MFKTEVWFDDEFLSDTVPEIEQLSPSSPDLSDSWESNVFEMSSKAANESKEMLQLQQPQQNIYDNYQQGNAQSFLFPLGSLPSNQLVPQLPSHTLHSPDVRLQDPFRSLAQFATDQHSQHMQHHHQQQQHQQQQQQQQQQQLIQPVQVVGVSPASIATVPHISLPGDLAPTRTSSRTSSSSSISSSAASTPSPRHYHTPNSKDSSPLPPCSMVLEHVAAGAPSSSVAEEATKTLLGLVPSLSELATKPKSNRGGSRAHNSKSGAENEVKVIKRERNRLAAEKYRKKGRELVEQLEKACSLMAIENGELKTANIRLENEVKYLKELLAQFGGPSDSRQ